MGWMHGQNKKLEIIGGKVRQRTKDVSENKKGQSLDGRIA